MNIIMSPAKTFNLKNQILKNWDINLMTENIVNVLKGKSELEIKNELKLSDKLLNTKWDYIKKFDEKKSYNAVEMYFGTAFKSLDINSLDEKSKDYIKNHMFILSAFYGVLRPYDLVKPYRLDFNSKLKIDNVSLKKYWKDYYNSKISKGSVVINLASNEFADLFDKTNYEWHDFEFFEIKGGKEVKNSTVAKKCRGKLLREMAINNITTSERICNLKGYGKYFIKKTV